MKLQCLPSIFCLASPVGSDYSPGIYKLHRHASNMGKSQTAPKAKTKPKHPAEKIEKKVESKKAPRNPPTPKCLVDIPAQCLQHGFQERIMHTRSWRLASSSVWDPESGQEHVISMNNDNYSSAVAALDEIYPHGELLPSSSDYPESSYESVIGHRSNTGRGLIPEARTHHSSYMRPQHPPAYIPVVSHLSPYGNLGFDGMDLELQRFPTLSTECASMWPNIHMDPQNTNVLGQGSMSLESNMTTVNNTAYFENGGGRLFDPSGMYPSITEGGQPLPYYNQGTSQPPVVALYQDDAFYSKPPSLPNNMDSVNSYLYDQSYFPFDSQDH